LRVTTIFGFEKRAPGGETTLEASFGNEQGHVLMPSLSAS